MNRGKQFIIITTKRRWILWKMKSRSSVVALYKNQKFSEFSINFVSSARKNILANLINAQREQFIRAVFRNQNYKKLAKCNK
jgi:hypothetical protein